MKDDFASPSAFPLGGRRTANSNESSDDEENIDRRQKLINILGRALEVTAPTPENASASTTIATSTWSRSRADSPTRDQQPSAESQRRLTDAVHRSLLAAAARQAECREHAFRLEHQEQSTSVNSDYRESDNANDDDSGGGDDDEDEDKTAGSSTTKEGN